MALLHRNRKEIAIVLVMALLLVGVWLIVSRVDTAQHGAQTQFVADAVRNAALNCYAVEGAYQNDLEYLRSHYGLAYDQDRYFVTYDAFASNQLPEINVVEWEADAS